MSKEKCLACRYKQEYKNGQNVFTCRDCGHKIKIGENKKA